MARATQLPVARGKGDVILSIKHLKKSYGSRTVLSDVSFDVERGRVVVLLGRSGSGKSTLIRTINGLESIQGGRIEFEGTDISHSSERQWQALRTRIGMVFQSYDLFPNLTVAQNIMLAPLKVQRRPQAEVERQMGELLERVQLTEYRDAYPRQLSGGQKQRIAIVRALCMNPDVMLFDEVTASLDPEMVREVLELILRLARERMTMIVVTHELDFARRVADRVLFLDDGRILESGTAADFFDHPTSAQARDFLNSMQAPVV